MNIGIIGSGNIGSALVRHLTARGHHVTVANSRGPETLTALATETGAHAGTVEEAASARDLIIIAVPETAISKLPRNILSASKAIIIDTGNYYPSRDGKIAEIDTGLTDSEWVSKMIGHDVIKVFNNIFAQSLATKALPAGRQNRVALSVAGNNPQERQTVMHLIEEIGFDAVDAGTLADSWRQQPGTPAYCHDLSTEALKSALQEADRGQVPKYRNTADDAIKHYFA
jgi:predicted dinucleotide-binding enzyme